jgi:ribosome-associated protein
MTKKKAVKKAKVVKPARKAGKPVKKSGAAKKTSKVKSKSKSGAKKKVVTKSQKSVAKPAKKAVAKPVKPVAKAAPKAKDEGRILADSVVNGMLEKKGQNIRLLDLRGIENAVCDYFIICEGGSNTQVEAIAESVEDIVKKETSQRPYRSEGWENALWILIDYINVVVHVFERETRYFYNLESLWADAEEIKVKQ